MWLPEVVVGAFQTHQEIYLLFSLQSVPIIATQIRSKGFAIEHLQLFSRSQSAK
jgi:hypothetical protein